MAEYIDRGALQAALVRKSCGAANRRYTDGWNDCLLRVKSMVSKAPASDVAPVVHGRWIYKGDSDMWVCSRCGRSVNNNPEGIDLYCYHCGAKMDEKEGTQ